MDKGLANAGAAGLLRSFHTGRGGSVAERVIGEVCAACEQVKQGTVEVVTGEHTGERVCQECLNLLITAARNGRADGKRIVAAQDEIVERGRNRHRGAKLN